MVYKEVPVLTVLDVQDSSSGKLHELLAQGTEAEVEMAVHRQDGLAC